MEKIEFSPNANEVDREKPYTAETFRQVGLKKLAHLIAIKELMESDGYEQKRQAFEEESERLSAEIGRYTAPIGEWEEQMTQNIMDDDTLSDEQKQRKMQNEVYGKVDEMYRQAERSEEYQRAAERHRKFMKSNELMWDSTLYNLKRTSPESLPFINLTKALAGEESEEIEFEMPSDCIYDQIEEQQKYIESGYLEDYKQAIAEDERAKKLSTLQLDYLFSECDAVCFHAEEGIHIGEECDERFAQVLDEVFRTEKTVNYGMNVLRIYLKPTQKLKDYLMSFKRFDRYHCDAYQRYDLYFSFADILFLKNGEALLSCLTHEGYFDVADGIKSVFDGFEEQAENHTNRK